MGGLRKLWYSQRPSRPVLDARTRYCTGPYFYREEHYCARGAARIVICSCNGREAMSPIWMEVARVAGSLGYIVNWPFYKAVCCVDGMKRRCCACSSQLDCIRCNAPVELHDTSRGRRRCGGIQCNAYSQMIPCCRRRVSQSVGQ